MTTKKGFPNTKYKVIRTLFSRAESDLQLVTKGKKIPDETGIFGDPRELLVFELAKSIENSVESLEKAISADKVLLEIFRDVREDPSVLEMIQSMTLGLYGLILGNYNEEDFRYLYRYSLKHVRNHQKIEQWLRKALVLLAASQYDDEREIMSEIRLWLQFLGAPIFSPASFVKYGEELGVDIKSVVDSEEFKFVDALSRHSQYLREAIEGRPFLEVYNFCKEWTPDALLSDLLAITREKAYKGAQEVVESDMDVTQSFEAVKKHFKKNQF
ncbi:MAG: hypothetical protein ACXAB5_04075, partial [Candidatus Thorarchaeota archaeon]